MNSISRIHWTNKRAETIIQVQIARKEFVMLTQNILELQAANGGPSAQKKQTA